MSRHNKKIIPITETYLKGKERKYVNDVLRSGWISVGEYVERFEKKFAEYVGSKYAVSTCNGTCALHLALKSLNINFYDHIILPNYTFVATAEAARYCTEHLSFIEPDETWNIDYKKIEKKIKDNTRAIIPVHLYGNPCNMDEFIKIKKDNPDIFIVEDACESLGAYYNNKHVGTFGDISCFSFFGNKNISCGEGGMCVTNDEKLYKRMLKLRHHGKTKQRYYHDELGYNYGMSNLNAAIGLAQLENIDEILLKKTKVKNLYDKYLQHP